MLNHSLFQNISDRFMRKIMAGFNSAADTGSDYARGSPGTERAALIRAFQVRDRLTNIVSKRETKQKRKCLLPRETSPAIERSP